MKMLSLEPHKCPKCHKRRKMKVMHSSIIRGRISMEGTS
jgi:hypothetical protein